MKQLDCYYKQRYERTQTENNQQNQNLQGGMGERARPVLGVQPSAPRSRPLRYVDTHEGGTSLEMVPAAPYYYEEDAPSSIQSYNAMSEPGNETSRTLDQHGCTDLHAHGKRGI